MIFLPTFLRNYATLVLRKVIIVFLVIVVIIFIYCSDLFIANAGFGAFYEQINFIIMVTIIAALISIVMFSSSKSVSYTRNQIYQDIYIMGKIGAGPAVEDIARRNQTLFPIPEKYIGSGPHFALRVVGDSMVEDGIIEGDIAIIRKQDTANIGDTVVALIDGEEATLKVVSGYTSSTIAISPRNDAYTTLNFASSRVKIMGILVGLFRAIPNK